VLKLLGDADDDSVCAWLMGKLNITDTQARHMGGRLQAARLRAAQPEGDG